MKRKIITLLLLTLTTCSIALSASAATKSGSASSRSSKVKLSTGHTTYLTNYKSQLDRQVKKNLITQSAADTLYLNCRNSLAYCEQGEGYCGYDYCPYDGSGASSSSGYGRGGCCRR